MTMWLPEIEDRHGPRYIAISDALADDIQAGNVTAGDRLPTHRELAYQLGVTVGTVSRAYAEAERRGLTYGEVGRGTYVQGGSGPTSNETAFFRTENTEGNKIDFGLNMPAAGERASVLSETLQDIARSPHLDDYLAYQTEGGLFSHRTAIANWLEQYGLVNNPEQIVISNGAQHALTVVLMAMTSPGDLVAAENYTYPAIQGLTQQLGLKIAGLEIDELGIIPGAFERLCQTRPPKMLYCLPTLQNPTTAVMPEERRQEIAAIAQHYSVMIMDDDVYGYLVEDAPPPLSVFAPKNSFFISSASKFLAPGLRIGFIHSPAQHIDKIRSTLQLTTWMAAPLMAEVEKRWLEDGTADRFIKWHRAEAQFRQKQVSRILQDAEISTHPSSYHLWLKMPPQWRAENFVSRVAEKGVTILPSSTFAIGSASSVEAVRICLGSPASREEVEAGLTIIAETLDEAQPPSSNVF
ncbi:MAG: PLP-dependent aminotransferase family protein [Rhodospirillaceae bacterium]|jgi:DNA-binding transcriptional MocR family regulator|nr:PLP-dependent aminotransferase family protein [Rhodospirillaceae bacterium]MBT4588271.1 PLP-dependent aminotransferase family protein [Rhodospirillaceae bacterium]MBT7269209.1 PLP-dependent aminotransferase family protein [Rhodospirillaceae bacterium]